MPPHFVYRSFIALLWVTGNVLSIAEEGDPRIKHSIMFNIDGQDTHLHFSERDDFEALSLAFVTRHGLDALNHELACESGVSAARCVSRVVAAKMAEEMSFQVANNAARGLGSFDVSPAPKLSLVVVDDFLSHPQAMRKFALSCDFLYKGNHPGLRSTSFANFLAFRPIRRKVEALVGEKLPFWFASFQRSFANDTDNGVHRDYPTYKYSALLYLNPEADPGLGTSTWRHKETGLYDYPTEAEARKFYAHTSASENNAVDSSNGSSSGSSSPGGERAARTIEAEADYPLAARLADKLAKDPGEEAFDEVDRVGNRFNRLLVFNSRLNHRSSSLGGKGSSGQVDDARLVLILFFNTEDKVGQSGSVLWEDFDAYEER